MSRLTFQLAGALLALLLSAADLCAQTTSRRIADLNPGGVGSFPSNFTTFNGALYFSAYTFELGREFWKYDGAAITLVTNINDTSHDIGGGVFAGNDSVPDWFTPFNGALYFSAYDQRRGGELWRYDGTRATRVADINPDMNDLIKPLPKNSWPYELVVFNNALYFSADGGSPFFPNYELWRCNGTSATLVTNMHPDFGPNYSSYPTRFKVFNNALYFIADDGLNGYELWKHSAAGTVLFTNINPGGAGSGSYPKNLTPFGNALYFQAYDDVHGFELWKTDGTTTLLVTNLNPVDSSYPESFTVFSNALYFRATDGVTGFELWKWNGTSVTLAADLNPSGDSSPKNFTVFKNRLYFAADDGVHGWELWSFDGTSASLVADLNPTGDSFPESLTVWNNHLWFTGTNEAFGYEVWEFDGQTVSLAVDIQPGPLSSHPLFLAGFGPEVCLSANDSPFDDWEPWAIRLNLLRITAIDHLGSDIRLTWRAMGGTTNIVQSATNITGTFQDLSAPIYIPGSSETETNYVISHVILTNAARFYRIVQP